MDALIDIINKLGFRTEIISGTRLAAALIVGGLLALYVRFLYNRCSTSVSNSEAFSNNFPLLVLVTTCVIAVVKSSLALSLGLVGALSIVRFRAAIKDPEELIYLFLCIAIGLSLGAGQIQFAFILVFIASVFIFIRRFLGKKSKPHNLMLTITGEADKYFDDPSNGALSVIEGNAEVFSIQRYEVEENIGILRVAVGKTSAAETVNLITNLRKKLPGCHISYVNMDTLL